MFFIYKKAIKVLYIIIIYTQIPITLRSDYLSEKMISVSYKDIQTGWVVLSEIEQRIKDKIEKVGIPLKDWDINIYRGVITGFNEAFIIDNEKRKELIEKSPRSAEIIRPILRGRDICKYSVEFADLWVILVKFNSHKFLNEDYPAIYEHLVQYESKLKERGQCRYSRAKRVNDKLNYLGQHHWLELDNNPKDDYLNSFLTSKIIYPNMTKYLPFVYDIEGYYINDKAFYITGKHIEYLTVFLNSSLFKFCFVNNFPELQGGTREIRKIFLDKISVLQIDDKTNDNFNEVVLKIQSTKKENGDTKNLEIIADSMIFDLYKLTQEERNEIGFIEIY